MGMHKVPLMMTNPPRERCLTPAIQVPQEEVPADIISVTLPK